MEDKFLTIDNDEFLVVDELVDENGRKFIFANSMVDERDVAILEEVEKDGETMIKSVNDEELESVIKKFDNKLLGD